MAFPPGTDQSTDHHSVREMTSAFIAASETRSVSTRAEHREEGNRKQARLTQAAGIIRVYSRLVTILTVDWR